MTLALGWPLQEAVFAALTADPGVQALAAGRIYDAVPPASGEAEVISVYAVIGDDTVQEWGTGTDAGSQHLFGISIFAAERSFAQAKALAGAIGDVMVTAPLPLSRGRVVCVSFFSARTRREERDRLRRIDLRFRVLIEDTA
ncbi:MAG: DUF3168 domain-containing protein [Pseudomonadota bacterium]